MIKKDLEKELVKLVEERRRRRNFIEYICRKEILIPLGIVLLVLIDDPDITITKFVVKIIKSIGGL